MVWYDMTASALWKKIFQPWKISLKGKLIKSTDRSRIWQQRGIWWSRIKAAQVMFFTVEACWKTTLKSSFISWRFPQIYVLGLESCSAWHLIRKHPSFNLHAYLTACKRSQQSENQFWYYNGKSSGVPDWRPVYMTQNVWN